MDEMGFRILGEDLLGQDFTVRRRMGKSGAMDTTAPSVTGFAATTPTSSLNIPITTFTASEGGVSFIITTSSTPPAAGAAGWSGTAPATYTVAAAAQYTLYPWVKDAAGNVSAVYGSPVSVLVIVPVFWLRPDLISGNDGDASATFPDAGGVNTFTQDDNDKKALLKKGANGINSKNILLFDGSNDLYVKAGTVSTATAGVLFSVVRLTAAVQNYETLLCSADEATNLRYIYFRPYESATHNKMSITQKENDTADAVKGATTPVAGTAYLFTWISTGTAWEYHINGAVEGLTVIGGGNNGDWFGDVSARDNMAIGMVKYNSEVTPIKAGVGDVLLLDGVQDGDYIRAIESYLCTYYGLTLANP